MFFLRQKTSGLSPAEAISRAAAGDLTVIDVREQSELAASGKASGALHIPLMRLPDRADPRHPDFLTELRPDRPIAIYCASGGRSASAEMMLRRLGYADVHNIGGLGQLAESAAWCR